MRFRDGSGEKSDLTWQALCALLIALGDDRAELAFSSSIVQL